MLKKHDKSRVLLALLFFALVSPTFSQPAPGGRQRPRPFEGIRNRFRPGSQGGRPQFQGQQNNLSPEEIVAAVREKLSQFAQDDPELYENIMQRFDEDQDGQLNEQECMNLHMEHKKRQGQGNRPPSMGGQGGAPGMRPPGVPVPPDHMGLLDGIEIDGFVPPSPPPPMPPPEGF